MSSTAVVILNWNGLAWLKMFLPDVVRYSTGNNVRVYVADNGSTDGSYKWVSDNFRDISSLRFDKNNGFARGYNLALNQIEADYYVLLNSDVEVTEGWLLPLIDFMERHPETASCQPKIRSFYNRDHFEYAGAAGGFIDRYGYTFCRGRIFDRVEKDEGQYDDSRDIFWSTGACMVVRSDAWKKCGGFDSDFFAHMEEVDLCWRFLKAGYKVSYVPRSVVFHVGGGVLPYNSELKIYLNFRNNLFLLYKNLPDETLHKIILFRKLLDCIAALMFLVKGRFSGVKAICNAHCDYYKSLKNLKNKRNSVKEISITEPGTVILNKSIVFGFYLKNKKTFKRIALQ